VRQARRERLAQPGHLDAVAEQQADNVRRRLRIVARHDHDAFDAIGRRFRERGAAEVVVVLQPALPVLRRRLECRQDATKWWEMPSRKVVMLRRRGAFGTPAAVSLVVIPVAPWNVSFVQ